MKNKHAAILSSLLLSLSVSTATEAATVNLFDYGFNIDSSLTLFGDVLPGEINASGFDFSNGLGSINVSLSGGGAHSFDAFFDHDIDDATNTFFNETGASSGVALSGQSWEVDEPFNGDIYFNFEDSTLSNSVVTAGPEDISLAMGWDFTLASNETALISLLLSETAPTSGFFLTHSDPDSNASIYLSSSLSITAVPVPGALWLMASGLLGLVAMKRRASTVRNET